MALQSYRDLLVWQKSFALARAVYLLTATYPPSEQYGLSSQMRRAAISIPSNIAEGSCRGTRKDYRNFLLNAFGSGAELETQTALGRSLGFGQETLYKEVESLLNEVMRMLNYMIKKLAPTPRERVSRTYNLEPIT